MNYGLFPATLRQIQQSIACYGFEEKFEGGTIDTTNKWTQTVAGTGAVALSGIFLGLSSGANAGGSVALNAKQIFPVASSTIYSGGGVQFKKYTLEFTAYFDQVAKIENASFFIGMSSAAGGTRTQATCFGFILDGDVLKALVDDAGAELVSGDLGITLTGKHVYKIEFDYRTVLFYVDDVLVYTGDNSASSISDCPYIDFYIKSDAAGAAILYVAGIRAGFEK